MTRHVFQSCADIGTRLPFEGCIDAARGPRRAKEVTRGFVGRYGALLWPGGEGRVLEGVVQEYVILVFQMPARDLVVERLVGGSGVPEGEALLEEGEEEFWDVEKLSVPSVGRTLDEVVALREIREETLEERNPESEKLEELKSDLENLLMTTSVDRNEGQEGAAAAAEEEEEEEKEEKEREASGPDAGPSSSVDAPSDERRFACVLQSPDGAAVEGTCTEIFFTPEDLQEHIDKDHAFEEE